MKKLVTKTQMEEYSHTGPTEFTVGEDTILTLSAKDLARNKGIKLVYRKSDGSGGSGEAVCAKMPGTDETASCKKDADPDESAECDDDCGLDRETVVKAVIEVLKEKGLLDGLM